MTDTDKPVLIGSLREDLTSLVHRIVVASRAAPMTVWVDHLAEVYAARAETVPLIDPTWLVGIYDVENVPSDVDRDLDDYRRRRTLQWRWD